MASATGWNPTACTRYGPRVPTSRGTKEIVTGVLAGLALWGWVTATSARWSWALAARGRLPDEALVLTWLRGPAPVVRGLVALVAAALTVTVVVLLASRAGYGWAIGAGALALPLVSTLTLHAILSPPYPGVGVAFDVLRPGLERAAVLTAEEAGARDYGGAPLPWQYRAFTSNGRASADDHLVFLPQWTGIPDDGGGFFFSPHGSPEGYDMFGMVCEAPLRLDDAWWACGMSPEPAGSW